MQPSLLVHNLRDRDELIDQFWAGQVSEKDFIERGVRMGMTLEALGVVIAEVREQDGTS